MPSDKRPTFPAAPVVGRGVKLKAPAYIPLWGIKLVQRIAQFTSKPGIYPATLIVDKDGNRELVVEGGKRERLGK